MGVTASGLCHMEEEVFQAEEKHVLWDLTSQEIIKSTRCDNCDPFSSCLLTQTMAFAAACSASHQRASHSGAAGPWRLASGGAASLL